MEKTTRGGKRIGSGRKPHREDGKKRTEGVKVNLTPEEKELLLQKAQGKPLSEYFRDLALHAK